MRAERPFVDEALAAFVVDPLAAEGYLWPVEEPEACAEIAEALDARAMTLGRPTLTADWRAGVIRPFGPLLDLVEDAAAYLEPRRPDITKRLAWTLSNVLYPWRKAASVDRPAELRPGLADFALRGDARTVHEFFQKRDLRPQVLAFLVRLLAEAVRMKAHETSGPVLVHLTNAHLADRLTLSALQLLLRYARQQHLPMTIGLVGAASAHSPFATLLGAAADSGWTVRTSRRRSTAGSPDVHALFTPRELDALRPASVHALPFRPRDWLASLPVDLRPTAEAVKDTLLRTRVLTWVGPDRIRFVRGDVREAIYATHSRDAAAARHRHLLNGDEAGDAFAAAWHAARTHDRGHRAIYLEAMQRAWAVSAYECALELADFALGEPVNGDSIDANLLLAMLNYEAGNYGVSDRLFDAALRAPHPSVDRVLLTYLHGYNAIFGTGDYAKGIRLLTSVLDAHEATGDVRTVAYVRNSLAYAHFRSKHVADAMAAEETNIREVGIGSGPTADRFLESILQLNLGRLYSHVGDLDGAIRTVEAGLQSTRAELDAHILLLSYATLGSVQAAAGRRREALSTYAHVFELVRNMQLDSVKDQVLFALAKSAPRVPADSMTRTDEILFYVHFHLGRLLRQVDGGRRARAYRDAVVATGSAIDTGFGDAVRTALDAPESSPLERESPRAALDAREMLVAFRDAIVEPVPRLEPADAMAATLADGGTTALLAEHSVGAGVVRFPQSVVLYDVRNAETAARISQEFGGSYVPQATAALVLPEGADLFAHAGMRTGVQQMATITREWGARLPGLVPTGLNVQILSEAVDGILYRILSAFHRRSGVPLLGVTPFHLWRGDLAVTPPHAVQSFLVTSVDRLCLADRVIDKVHGPTAVQNIARYRPRLAEEAVVFESRGACLIEIEKKGGYATGEVLKVHAQTRAILDLCDGTRDVAALVERLTHSRDLTSASAERLASLLRGLWRRGALCFDPPVPEPAIAVGAP